MLRDDIIIRAAIEAHSEIQIQFAQPQPRLFRTKLAQWTLPGEVTNYYIHSFQPLLLGYIYIIPLVNFDPECMIVHMNTLIPTLREGGGRWAK